MYLAPSVLCTRNSLRHPGAIAPTPFRSKPDEVRLVYWCPNTKKSHQAVTEKSDLVFCSRKRKSSLCALCSKAFIETTHCTHVLACFRRRRKEKRICIQVSINLCETGESMGCCGFLDTRHQEQLTEQRRDWAMRCFYAGQAANLHSSPRGGGGTWRG
ncbi:hypothetical protein BaRGS_00007463, partial [Batillaria attramentaria]